MVKIGTGATEEHINKETTKNYTKIGRFEEGEYVHRAIDGPIRKEFVLYPSFYTDYETGETKETLHSVTIIPESRTIFDKLAAIERKVQQNHGIDKMHIETQFGKSVRFIWLVLSRTQKDENGNPYIGPWEYPPVISDKLIEFNRISDVKDESKLRYGLFYTFDHIVKKWYDKKTMEKTGGNKRFATRYSLDVDPSCVPMAGKLPIEILKASYQKEHTDKIQKLITQVFTPEELDLIEESGFSLDSLRDSTRPVESDEEILEILAEHPINWNATDVNGKSKFKFKEELFKEIQEFEGRLLESVNIKPQLSSGETDSKEKLSKTENDGLEDFEDLPGFSVDEKDDLGW